uniref:Uncharacterized protein n=1 Tax=Ciona intestinalis TaxID=7719 RepID=H2Y2X5_CIOIN
MGRRMRIEAAQTDGYVKINMQFKLGRKTCYTKPINKQENFCQKETKVNFYSQQKFNENFCQIVEVTI